LKRALVQWKENAPELQNTAERDFAELGRLYTAYAELTLRHDADVAAIK
jgi:hypothetical protein